jgi:hypothetical protein
VNYIVRYQKVIDNYTTHQLMAYDGNGNSVAQELCELPDGYTYVSVQDGVTLPAQSDRITIESVTLTPDLREEIKDASPHVQLIRQRVVDRIREKYTQDDEFKLTRLAISGSLMGRSTLSDSEVSELTAFEDHVSAAVAWGAEQKATLGLT